MNSRIIVIPWFKALLLAISVCFPTTAAEDRPAVLLARNPTRLVSGETMRQMFEEINTPFKFGIVIRGDNGNAVDCPSIFRHQQKWYMVYVCMNKVGYETHLAQSDDLLHWVKLGRVLAFRQNGWDAWQTAGGIALHDYAWGGSGELHTFDDKYWMSYVGGALQGYETDPLACSATITFPHERQLEFPVSGAGGGSPSDN